ncbi:ACT domain-containing protein [Dactylosporangium aurantiacum]|uniref:ACT domain-containing protein n=1 Tax=Dactylosporangium aurantiacum TaxID=35754 RepID=A0A9Q9II66_9ACTN|nr:ACT domain-containing protein [Dactylosporangium aurantiacum]MDG6110041.1 ACT domain-containing protein [Dactylosporangium aurantiacum]UWZ54605.1 ACT domain-containing protein [Dactylosporangium aurantiacum]
MLDLQVLPGDYAICRLPAGSPVPPGLVEAVAAGTDVISVTWTPDEVSILCPADRAPAGASVETPWRCLRVAGPVQLALTGILASIVSPLADARVNIFAFSTFDTDYVLVPAVRLGEALAALNAAGHRVTTSGAV